MNSCVVGWQVAVGTLVSFVFVLIYGRCRPWARPAANTVTTLFQISLFLFFFSGLLLKVSFTTAVTGQGCKRSSPPRHMRAT